MKTSNTTWPKTLLLTVFFTGLLAFQGISQNLQYLVSEYSENYLIANANGTVTETQEPSNWANATWELVQTGNDGETVLKNVGTSQYLQAMDDGTLRVGAKNQEGSNWYKTLLEDTDGYTYITLWNAISQGYLYSENGAVATAYLEDEAPETVWICEPAFDQGTVATTNGTQGNWDNEVNSEDFDSGLENETGALDTNASENSPNSNNQGSNNSGGRTTVPVGNSDAQAINDYIRWLSYDPRVLLSVNNQGSIVPVQKKTSEGGETKKEGNNSVIVCRKTSYNLTTNVEDVAIMRPTNGIIWPGALVVANRSLAEGLPTPITSVTKAPTRITVDLPGLGDRGSVLVQNPSNSTIQAAIDNILETWNNSPDYKTQPAVSTYKETMAYSNEQVAVKLGVNYSQMGLSVSTELGVSTSNSRKVFIVMYKQVFYTVNLDLPPNPADYFAPTVGIGDIQSAMNETAPPGYVQSVSYGRILMFRMETSASTKDIDVKGAFEYTTGAQSVGVEAETQYKQILENSNISVITLGGDARAASEPVSAKNAGDLAKYIQGDNAVYSRNNPGVPISYTVRFLKDHTVAKMGLTTDYSKEECEEFPNLYVKLNHAGAYVAKFFLDYTVEGQPKKWESGEKTAGWTQTVNLPYNAKNIRLNAVAATGLVWDPWGEIIKKTLNGNDVNKCYKVVGTTLNRNFDNNCN
ncbi:thiol-activated cytolysin family protein [Marixanthomonas spongiae]|uniref:Thiol-activated cytolysin C-terminal domain-containing protein n=1 Tax=Marixanthomonas spongiae TaxID=2174845 RepID=A0A2U0I5X8_9FLAO|nr:thiol-activated cytolysin family protein [Marixanthomonas spongiae]PVW16505.1 hypothetical protein DDV96_04440 [Marixanthomonas spongiae]